MLHLTPAATPTTPQCVVERYSYFQDMLRVVGHVLCADAEPTSLVLRFPDGRQFPIVHLGLPSPDLTRHHGPRAGSCRFSALFNVGPDAAGLWPASLVLGLSDGSSHDIDVPAGDPQDPSVLLMQRFFGLLAQRPPGHMLEIGSRMRTGALYTGHLPPGWRYTGLDVMAGENVDVVGDAHQLSRLLPLRSFDAIMSFVVFEHLLMPWKVALEMNHVLREGGLALVMAPQTWPLHEEPCDYFRFSKHAWKALFNHATGFEILAAVHGSPAYVVAQQFSPTAHFGEAHQVALMSCVLVRKVAETALQWPVEMNAIAQDVYPF